MLDPKSNRASINYMYQIHEEDKPIHGHGKEYGQFYVR